MFISTVDFFFFLALFKNFLLDLQNILNSKQKKYDVLFLEFMPFYECYIPIAEKLNIPVIGTLPVRSYYLADLPMGIPRNPAVIVNELASFKKKMTFFQRLNNTYRTILLYAFDYFVTLPKLEKFYQRFFPNSTLDNLKKVSVVFINNHVIMLPRVQGPNVVDIGGLHVKPIKSKSLTPVSLFIKYYTYSEYQCHLLIVIVAKFYNA